LLSKSKRKRDSIIQIKKILAIVDIGLSLHVNVSAKEKE